MELLSIAGLGVSFDRSHRSRAHAKYARIRVLNYDTNRKSLSDPHPVEIALNGWHSINFTIIVLRLYRRRDSFDRPFELAIRVRPKIDLCRHTGTDTFQLALAKVRQHIPFSAIEEIKNVSAGMRVETFGNVKSHDLAIKRCIDF